MVQRKKNRLNQKNSDSKKKRGKIKKKDVFSF